MELIVNNTTSIAVHIFYPQDIQQNNAWIHVFLKSSFIHWQQLTLRAFTNSQKYFTETSPRRHRVGVRPKRSISSLLPALGRPYWISFSTTPMVFVIMPTIATVPEKGIPSMWPKKVKVTRALELLHRHFDIVTVADHATFMDKVLSWTGWTPSEMPHGNAYKRLFNFTKRQLEILQKLLQKNRFHRAGQVWVPWPFILPEQLSMKTNHFRGHYWYIIFY